jgi:hypothetical protein
MVISSPLRRGGYVEGLQDSLEYGFLKFASLSNEGRDDVISEIKEGI